jgi:hypothetical protein
MSIVVDGMWDRNAVFGPVRSGGVVPGAGVEPAVRFEPSSFRSLGLLLGTSPPDADADAGQDPAHLALRAR